VKDFQPMPEPADLKVEHNEAASRFEVCLAEHVAQLQYRLQDGEIVFIHTEVPAPFEGKGVGGKLAKAGLEYAKSKGLVVVAHCPFISSYISKHPEYAGLLKSTAPRA
jgi:predicted GNAT family acetyltransferase